MKKFLKYFGSGLLFFIMSVGCSMFGTAAYNGFVAIGTCEGWEAIGLCGVSCLLTFFALFLIYVMGLISLDSLERYKQRVKDLEDRNDY